MSKINEAGWDRIIRVLLGIFFLYLGWGNVVTGGWEWFFRIVGFIPLITGLIGYCPLYKIFNFKTNK